MTETKPPKGTSDDGLADGIFATEEYTAPKPSKKSFLPWHRPRKQFVRHKQWCGEVLKMLDGTATNEPLRYLGLPGVDLLDLRCFHQNVCVPRHQSMCFLGFNSGAGPASASQTDLNISLDEVRKLQFIDPTSEVIWDDFSRLSNQESLAWKRALQFGPYDVVNLDLCDGFGAHPADTLDDSHYSAVVNLLSLQARSKRPWLLLLTTRAGEEFVHADVLQRFLDQYLSNLENCPPFKTVSGDKFQVETAEALNAAKGDPHGMLGLFLVGLCKWLIALAVQQQPPSNVKIRSAIGYRVVPGAPCEDLVSLAIRFEPTFLPVHDKSGLAKPTAKPAAASECVFAVQAVQRIAARKDADAILAANPGLRQEMATAMAALLEQARYDVEAYHSWLEEMA
jgi:hypothetical protein